MECKNNSDIYHSSHWRIQGGGAVAAICLQKWGCPFTLSLFFLSLHSSLISCPPLFSFHFGCLTPKSSYEVWENVVSFFQRLRAQSDRQTLYCIFQLKILPLMTQHQQSTTHLFHNWNSELTLYANNQR